MSVYIRLLHGRNDPGEEMEQWGFAGPMLGPFDAVHFTYKEYVFGLVEGEERLELGYHEDMLVHDGRYYGDFEIASGQNHQGKERDKSQLNLQRPASRSRPIGTPRG